MKDTQRKSQDKVESDELPLAMNFG